MEWGNFWTSHLPRTTYDIDLDADSPNPNDQVNVIFVLFLFLLYTLIRQKFTCSFLFLIVGSVFEGNLKLLGICCRVLKK